MIRRDAYSPRNIIENQLDSQPQLPLVSIVMDIAAWDFVLGLVGEYELKDECVKIIKKSCLEALQTTFPNIMSKQERQ